MEGEEAAADRDGGGKEAEDVGARPAGSAEEQAGGATEKHGQAALSRAARRKAAKKDRRRQQRRQTAEQREAEEMAAMADPEERARREREEKEELEAEERERKQREEQEERWLQREKELELEAQRKHEQMLRQKLADAQKADGEERSDEDEEEGEEDGPPKIIWRGNEIIVVKKKGSKKGSKAVKVEEQTVSQTAEPSEPPWNPPPPQASVPLLYSMAALQAEKSAQQLNPVGSEAPDQKFGTEQDRVHCPFFLKTGACQFASACSRAHVYPTTSPTILIRHMFSVPGSSALPQDPEDEGLEHDEAYVAEHLAEFYADVHTEFQKYGEIVNFKVCRNLSPHLCGNVYVQFRRESSAVAAFMAVHGRFFASRQLFCEFVPVRSWRKAICGQYLRSAVQRGYDRATCNRGSTCNFLHPYENPEGDYEWADRDEPPPLYWRTNMHLLYGESPEEEAPTPREGEGRVQEEEQRRRLGLARKRRRSHERQEDEESRRSRRKEVGQREREQDDNRRGKEEVEWRSRRVEGRRNGRLHESDPPLKHRQSTAGRSTEAGSGASDEESDDSQRGVRRKGGQWVNGKNRGRSQEGNLHSDTFQESHGRRKVSEEHVERRTKGREGRRERDDYLSRIHRKDSEPKERKDSWSRRMGQHMTGEVRGEMDSAEEDEQERMRETSPNKKHSKQQYAGDGLKQRSRAENNRRELNDGSRLPQGNVDCRSSEVAGIANLRKEEEEDMDPFDRWGS